MAKQVKTNNLESSSEADFPLRSSLLEASCDTSRIPDPASFFASLAVSLPINVTCKDREGRIIFANDAFSSLMDRPATELCGKTDFDLFPEELANKYRADDELVMRSGATFHDVEENRAEGGKRYFEVHKAPLRDLEGNIIGTQAAFWDVTLQKQAEEQADHEHYLLHALMDNLPDSIYFKDLASRFIRCSKGQATKFGKDSPDEILGKTDADIFSPEHAQAARCDELEIMRTGQPVLGKIERETWKDAPDTWCSSTKMPLRDNDGNIVGTFGISRDITDLVKAEEALRQAKQAADAANRAKSDFLANMSHEIRTPMNAVIGISELLLNTELTGTQREYLDMVLCSGEALLALINDILDFSKIEAGKLELDNTVFDLRDALGDTIRSLGLRAHAKGLELAFSVDPRVPSLLEGDVRRLRQIIINLVGNAIKFTREGEVVLEVDCPSSDDRGAVLSFAVRDTGIGIPEDKIDKVFGEFEQADGSTTRDYGGTGLGLAICTRLVELLGGQLTAESDVGIGSTFRFTANLGIPPAREFRLKVRPVVVAGMRALIVDDNETNRRILHDMLSNWGMRPITASGAAEALDILRASHDTGQPISLVLADVNMPEMDGFHLTEAIRTDARLADAIVIMLTSGLRDGDTQRCRDLAVAARLIKPVKQSEVFDSIITALNVDAVSMTEDGQAETVQPGQVKSLRVLLAEDNMVNQKLAIGVLEQQGHQVTVANNGREAVEAWEPGRFDLILMDVQMPEMDGFEATRAIREFESTRGGQTLIIAMTARAMESDRQQCLAAGMDDYLAKPIRIAELATRLAVAGNSTGSLPTGGDSATGDFTVRTVAACSKTTWTREVPQAPSVAELSGAVDWKHALRSMHGSQDLLRVIVGTLLDETPKLIQAVQEAMDQGDAACLQRAAHSLKGSVLFLGVDLVAQPAAELETMGQRGEILNPGPLLAKVHSEWEELAQELNEFVARSGTD